MKLSIIGTIGTLLFSGLAIEYWYNNSAWITCFVVACVFFILNGCGYIQNNLSTRKKWRRNRIVSAKTKLRKVVM